MEVEIIPLMRTLPSAVMKHKSMAQDWNIPSLVFEQGFRYVCFLVCMSYQVHTSIWGNNECHTNFTITASGILIFLSGAQPVFLSARFRSDGMALSLTCSTAAGRRHAMETRARIVSS